MTLRALFRSLQKSSFKEYTLALIEGIRSADIEVWKL